jgi:hypothetical protein
VAAQGIHLLDRRRQRRGLRYDNWKLAFMEQRKHGFDVWQDPMVTLRVPKLFDLRADPFERADHEGMGYGRWRIDRIYLLVPAQVYVERIHQDAGRVSAAPEARLVQPGRRAAKTHLSAAERELEREYSRGEGPAGRPRRVADGRRGV